MSNVKLAAPQYMTGLNPAQKQAVETMDGPVLMLAGAGTGKTRALTTRIAHLLYSRKCQPHEILAVTFTNKAAREMKERVSKLTGMIEGLPWLGTFHSVCVKILRRHAELVGLNSNFTILDTDDQIRLLKQLIRVEAIEEKRWPPRVLASLIDGWKNQALMPDQLSEEENQRYANGRGKRMYTLYQERLKTLNAVDFGDIVLLCLKLLQNNQDVLNQYHRWFKYILVDEYQDTNITQYLWLQLLAQSHHNICCVGDDDQSIYGWRGAEVGNIMRFEKDFPDCVVIRLEQNYRSTPHILGAAAGIIATNKERLGKTLWTDQDSGEKVRLMGLWDGEDEARWIGEQIEDYQRGARHIKPVSLNNIAILVRASFQMRAFEDRFLAIGLPYRVIGGPRFYERMEIRDALAYLRVIASMDDSLAFERIVNTPKRGIGDKALQTLNKAARAQGISLLRGAQNAAHQLSARARNSLQELLDNFERWRGLSQTMSHVELAELVLDESGYTHMWQADKSPEAPGRLENLKELVRSMENFPTLQGFLEHISLVMENDQNTGGEKVSIMTLHGAKGLEFDCVFLPGMEDGLFPSQRSMDESGQKGLEEERRLAYVGITRARKHLTMTFSANRRVYNQWQSSLPSRFIEELPAAHVNVLTPPGLYGGNLRAAPAAEFIDEPSALEEAALNTGGGYTSPGWSRLKQTKPVFDTVTRQVTVPVYSKGTRVFHQKFGYGIVQEQERDKVIVEFEHAGEKNIMAAFLKHENDV